MKYVACLLLATAVVALELTHIPPMPDIDQIQTDEEWQAMMEEYEAVMVLRGKIARGEVSLEDALKPDEVGGVAGVAAAAPVAAVEAAPVAAAPEVPVAAVAPAAPVAAEAGAVAAPADDPLAARQEAVGNKVDDMLNASSDEEWNKMMEAYNKALSNNPVS